jgi:hypothetical protein
MCHHVPVRLSAEEKQVVRRLSNVLIPAYAVLASAGSPALSSVMRGTGMSSSPPFPPSQPPASPPPFRH